MMDGIESLIMCLFPLVSIYADPHALLDVCGGDTICKVYHELGKLLHVDDIPENCFMLRYIHRNKHALTLDHRSPR